MKHSGIKLLGIIAILALTAGLFTCAKNPSITRWHPVGMDVKPVCSECHRDEKAALDHRSDFNRRHKFYAVQQEQVCANCHKPSFCADCHINREKLKASDKFKDAPERTLPHRGDYLNQHRIDGRVNPVLCFKCHGRQSNQQCRVCHR